MTKIEIDAPVLDGRLADLLDGKLIVMTGVTGFIGEQMLWKILTRLPGTTAGVLVRPKKGLSAYERVVELLNKPIFDEVRQAAGDAEKLIETRMRVIEGDLPNVPDLPSDLDVLIHCAGDVSFDPPIDAAFKTNVLGTQALMTKLLEAVPPTSGRVPHYVHISTAYTAGRRRGPIPEAPHVHEADYRVETEWALKLAERIEIDSRTPERLAGFREEAERDTRRAGHLTTADETERLRREWVDHALVTAGTERARSLGWTDAYTFAKAMGERIVADLGREIEVSIVRPAIVESSLKDPFPGWIEGYKMAEPLIMAYGKGSLPELPVTPDAVIDIVPCDHVVNAIMAVCATHPQPGQPDVLHISSGARNPLTFREMYQHVRAHFEEHPFPAMVGKPLPTWSFPGAEQVERTLGRNQWALAKAVDALDLLPRSHRVRQLGKTLAKTRGQLDFLQRYLGIYGEYLRSELHFLDNRTLALHNSLHPDDREDFGFDTASFDWKTYLRDIHCPSVTRSTRDRQNARIAAGGQAPITLPEITPADDVVAVFDLHGTVMGANVVQTFLWARGAKSSGSRLKAAAGLATALPGLIHTERGDRGSFLRASYRRYAGINAADLERSIDGALGAKIRRSLHPEAIERIKAHRAAGHRTILMTGAIRPFTKPVEDLFDEVIAADLSVDDKGRYTGFLVGPPMVGEWRSSWLRQWAADQRVSLADSFAYADSLADLPLLAEVGHPVAVNPDLPLQRVVLERKWPQIEWGRKNPQ